MPCMKFEYRKFMKNYDYQILKYIPCSMDKDLGKDILPTEGKNGCR